jgi:copper(I)-binding protein
VSRSLRRGALAAALALSLAPLAACAAGNDAQTLQVKPDNAATTVGPIEIQNAVVLTKSGGKGPVSVSARVFNNGSGNQSLQSVTVGSKQAQISAQDGGQTITVPAHGSVLLGGKGNPSVTVPDTSLALRDGDYQDVTFTFSRTGEVTVRAYVEPARGYYASYGPSESGSPSASASTSPSATTSSSSKAPGSASASTSTSASPSSS